MFIKGELKDAQLELFTTATRPANGKKGRQIYDTDTDQVLTDDGASWQDPFDTLQNGFDADTAADQGAWRSKMHAIGDIVQSMLSEADFQTEYDTKWILCDGRSIGGSDLAALPGYSGTNAPDLRGRFTRMKDHGAGHNPDGDLALGTYQADEFKSHQHNISGGGGSDADPGFIDTTSGAILYTVPTDPAGGNETRPKNITVNYFIKINR